MTTEERFWAKVHKTEACWLWTAALDRAGYGAIRINSKTVKAHRYSWTLHYGPIPEIETNHRNGACVLHKCDTPACVRPDHLFIGNNTDNAKDRAVKGRTVSPPGEQNGKSRLTAQQVLEIRTMYQTGMYTQVEIGSIFGVGGRQISYIVNFQNTATLHER